MKRKDRGAPRDDNRMKRIVRQSPCSSIMEVQSALKAKGCHLGTMTVLWHLQYDFGLTSRNPARKPLLTKAKQDKRLKFANVHCHWTTEDWFKTLFSDKWSIQQIVVRERNVRSPRVNVTISNTQSQL